MSDDDDELALDTPPCWPLTHRGMLPREKWLWWAQLWRDASMLRERYRLPLRSGWWESEIQVETLAALAAAAASFDSGRWDEPVAKVTWLGDLERVAGLLRDGVDPFHPERDRAAFVHYVTRELGARPPRSPARPLEPPVPG
jgi:hypothetical protein